MQVHTYKNQIAGMKPKMFAFWYKWCVFPPDSQLYPIFTISQALNNSLGEWLMCNPELGNEDQIYTAILEAKFQEKSSPVRLKYVGK